MRFSVPRNGEVAPGLGGSWIRADGVEVSGEVLPFPVYVHLGYTPHGRPCATRVLLGDADRELTTRQSRIPLERIVAAFVAATTNTRTYKRLERELHGRERSRLEDEWEPELPEDGLGRIIAFIGVPRDLRHKPVNPRVHPGRSGHSDDHWRHVARTYKTARREHPGRHIQAMMDELFASEPTVHRWIKTARAKGFITDKQKED